jgi:Sulfatase/Putative metal-binding motif
VLVARALSADLLSLLGSAALTSLVFGISDLIRASSSANGWIGASSASAIVGIWMWFGQIVGVASWLTRHLVAALKLRMPKWIAWQTLPSVVAGGLTILLARKVLSGAGVRQTSVASWGAWVMPLAVTITAWVALWIAERLIAGPWRGASKSATIVFAIGLAVGAALLDAAAAGGYLYLHVLLLTLALVLSIEAAELIGVPLRAGRVALLVTLVVLPSLVAFPSSLRARELLARPTWAGLQLVDYAQQHLDFDHDGYSRAFGGGDCDDTRASVFPGAVERAGDGVDSDCDGFDEPKLSSLAFVPFHLRTTPRASEISSRAQSFPTVVILIDALRFDRIGDPRFPNLAQLARESIQFTRMYSTSSSTATSLPAMMTGRVRPASSRHTLAQALASANQLTTFIAPDVVMQHFHNAGQADPLLGFSFRKTISTDHGEGWGGGETTPTSDQITASAVELLDSAAPPSVSWLHYFDVHQWNMLKMNGIQSGSDASRYDAVLQRLDASLRPLLERRDRLNLVVLADHGEGLGARGVRYHTTFLFEELTHIPFLIRVPGTKPATVAVPVAGTGFFNTILALRGLAPDASADRSLLDLVGANDLGAGPGFPGFEAQQWSLVYGHHRLLYTPSIQLLELYDVDHDPREQNNLAEDDPQLASQMRARLVQLNNEPRQ